MKYRRDLECLRGFAMLLVFFYHFKRSLLPYGFIGVDIFFIICGYINGLCNFNTDNVILFYSKRIVRLYPMKLLCLYFIYFRTIFVKSVENVSKLENLISCLFDYSNYHFYFISVDYFQSFNETSDVIHFWSLSLENQFYIFFPFLLLLLKKVTIYIIVYLIFLIICTYESIYYNSYAYYSLSSRVNEFMLGLLLSFISIKFDYKFYNIIKSELLVIILLLISFQFISMSKIFFPLPFLLFVDPLVGYILLNKNNNGILNSSILQYFGNISYSFYLFHIPILNNLHKTEYVFLITLFTSSFTTYYLETPIRESKHKYVIITVIIIFIIILFKKIKKSINKYRQYISSFSYDNNDNSYMIQSPSDIDYTWNCNLFYKMCYCPFFKNKNENNENNILKNIFSNNVLFLIGDSHLEQWSFIIYPYARKMGYTILSLYCHGINIGTNKCNWLFDILNMFSNKYYTVISNYLLYNNTVKLTTYINKLLTIFKYIFVVQDVPHFLINPNNCLINNYNKFSCYAILNINATIINYPIIADERLIYINMNDYLCINKKCIFIYKGYPVYKDNNHLNLNFTYFLVEPFIERGFKLPKVNESRLICETAIWCRIGLSPQNYKYCENYKLKKY